MSADERRQLLAKLLAEKKSDPATSESPKRFPLAPAQKRLWFIDQLQPGQAVYIIPVTLRLEGEFDQQLLHRCLNEIVARHEVLRTRFVAEEGVPYQVIDPPFEFPPLGSKGDHDSFHAAPFDLAQGPLIRVRLKGNELYLAVHHIIADFWSLRVLLRELQLRYAAHLKSESANLPDLKIQYVDYAVWQEQQAAQLEAELDYWRNELAGVPDLLQLPTDSPRPGQPSFRGARQPIEFPKATAESLTQLARDQKTTTFSAMLAAFAAVLYRYTGQDDFCIGSTVTNRDREETRDLIGLFVNNLVFRSRPSADLTFAELLQATHATVLNGLRHQQVPFEQVVDTLQIERQLSYNPLFQVMFLLRTESGRQPDPPGGLNIQLVEHEHVTSRFDLSLELSETQDGLAGFFEFSADLFRPETVHRLGEHLQQFLAQVTATPDARIGDINLLSENERAQFASWNETREPIPSGCVHEQFEAQAAKTPAAQALTFRDQSWTYKELNERANQLAHHWKAQGAQPGQPIALLLERSEQLVFGLLAILKLGAHYVPLDPSHPRERLDDILEDSGAKWVLTEKEVSSVDSQPTTNLAINCSPEDLAYLIYTSGSTGRPKGVRIQHSNLSNLLTSMAREPGLSPDDRLLAVTTIAFDIATLELLLPLLQGAQVIIADSDTVTDGQALTSLLTSSDATMMQATPATWRLLLESNWSPLSGFKVLCGGEAMDLGLARQLLAHEIELWNLYGPTETTIWSGAFQITNERLARGHVPVGGPIANTGFHVLDERRQLVPIGVAGELHLSGAGLSPGYHDRDALTQEKFFETSFGRLYATGDRVRFREDGTLEFLGRFDHQIKLRGYRIELGEIESAIAVHPAIDNTVVTLAGEGPSSRLAAYCRINGEVADASLRDHLAQRLPGYMIPTDFVLLPDLPLTPNGKLDRKRLPAIAPSATEDVAAEPPGTPAEVALAEIWTDLLGRLIEDKHTNFFHAGGHSLLMARMIARIRSDRDVELPLRSVFDHPTLVELAAAIDAANQAPSLVIDKRPAEAPLVLSHAQHRQWVLNQLDPNSPAYHIPAAVRVRGELSLEKLKVAFATLCQRHDVLHTIFPTSPNGQPKPELVASSQPSINQIDVATIEEAQARMAAEVRRPIPLDRAPLMRVTCCQLAPDDHIVLIVLHHIIGDAWSLRVLFQELIQLTKSDDASLPTPLLQYADYVHFEQNRDTQTSRDYWRQKLSGAPTSLDLPFDHARLATPQPTAGDVRFKFGGRETQALEKLSNKHGTTLYITLLATLKTILHRYTGAEDIVIGSPVGHRPSKELESVVGLFVNTLALRTEFSGDQSFTALLDQVRTTVLDAFAHQDAPFEQVVQSLETDRDWDRSPLFQIMFLWDTDPALQAHNEIVEPVPLPPPAPKFDLTFSLAKDGDQIAGRIEYRSDLFGEATIAAFAEALTTLVGSIAEDPTLPLNRLPLLSPPPITVPAESNSDTCLHELINQQIAATPDSIAVISGDEKLTYRDLGKRTDELAAHLQSLRVGPEIPVGICLSRNADLVVAIVSVLKAGGAYVPIDPAYPKSRIEFVLQDASAPLVITDNENHGLLPKKQKSLNINEWGAAGTAQPRPHGFAANPAYVIYTSGSTGRPKGVTIKHRSIVGLVRWAQKNFDRNELAGVLFSTSICFDLSAYELFVPLSLGGTIIVAENALHLKELPHKDAVTLINTVPSAAAELVRQQAIPPNVITFNIAGEPLGKSLVTDLYAALAEHGDRAAVYNLYGPSEDTTYSTWCQTAPNETGVSTPVGRPVDNTQAHLLDPLLNPVPPGMAGDLYLGGEGLARGYWNRPALTAESFIPNPFGGEGRLLYRTGDRARLRPDGNLEFLGRADSQIKLRGFRIELGEIEQALESHPDINDSAATLADKTIVGYLVPTNAVNEAETLSPSSSAVEAYRAHLGERLPSYMIPSVFVSLPKIPRLPNGKLNRSALPKPDQAAGTDEVTPPTTDTEKSLWSIWTELLGRPQIGVHDNFFSLGGDSIIALQAIAKAQQQGLQLSPRDFFQHPTISALAAVAESNPAATKSRIKIDSSQELVVPLSPIQRWFFGLNLNHPEHWNQSLLLEVRESLNTDYLVTALIELSRHHHALRASFEPTDGGWTQTYRPATEVAPLTIVNDVTGNPAELIETTADEIQRSFDLVAGPLWHVVYFDLAACRRLLVVCHHLIVDGVSWRILLGDLQLLHAQLQRSNRVELLPPPTSTPDWIGVLLERDFSSEQKHWQDIDTQTAKLQLPLDNGRGSNTMGDAKTRQIEFTPGETRRLLTDAPKNYRIRIDELLITALARVVTRWTGHAELALQLEGHGRSTDDADLSRTVGWLTSLHPVIVTTSHNAPPGQSLKQTKDSLHRVPGQGIGYGFHRSEESAAAQIRFNYLGQADQLLGENSLFGRASESTGTARHPDDERDLVFELNAIVIEEKLVIHWIYGGQLHDPDTIERLTGDFRAEIILLADYCVTNEEDSGYTESEFPQMDFQPGELDNLLKELE